MPKIIFVLTLAITLVACNGMSTRAKGDGLMTAMDDYIAALRWGRFDKAKEYHLNKDGKRPEIDTSQLDHIRVTGEKFRKKTVNEALDEATVQVEVEYYNTDYGTLKKLMLNQVWWYQEETKSWYLSSDFPEF